MPEQLITPGGNPNAPGTFSFKREGATAGFSVTTEGVMLLGDGVTTPTINGVALGNLSIVNVKNYGAKGDGVTDDTTSIAAAIAAVGAGGIVFFPAGSYITSSALTLTSYIKLVGEGGQRSRITNSTSNMFTSGSSAVYQITFDGMYLVAGAAAGHIFAPGTGGIASSVFRDSTFTQNNTGKSIYLNNTSAGNNTFINNLWIGCNFQGSLSHTVPLFYLSSTGGFCNQNMFISCQVITSGNYPFYFEELAASNYTYDNVFIGILFEQCNGGGIKGVSANSWRIADCHHYDQGTITADLFVFDKSASGPASRFITFERVNRRGGTIGAFNDIKLATNNATLVDIVQCGTASGNLIVDLGTCSFVKFRNTLATVTNPNTAHVASGVTTADTNITNVVSHFAGSGSPLNVVVAPIGSTYQRADGGAGTSFYVKESGNGASTGWVAK